MHDLLKFLLASSRRRLLPTLDFSTGTFTRSTEAARDSSPYSSLNDAWYWAAVDELRQYSDGSILMEGGSQNNLIRTEELDTWTSVASATVNADVATAPDLVSDADEVVFPADGNALIYRTINSNDNDVVVFSVYARVSSGTEDFRLSIQRRTGTTTNLTATATTEWQRFTFTTSVGAGENGTRCQLRNAADAQARTIEFWGAHALIVGTISHIPTYIRAGAIVESRGNEKLTFLSAPEQMRQGIWQFSFYPETAINSSLTVEQNLFVFGSEDDRVYLSSDDLIVEIGGVVRASVEILTNVHERITVKIDLINRLLHISGDAVVGNGVYPITGTLGFATGLMQVGQFDETNPFYGRIGRVILIRPLQPGEQVVDLGLLSLTRATIATAFLPDFGLSSSPDYYEFAVNEPRRLFLMGTSLTNGEDGLLTEGPATNLLFWSQDFDNAVWNTLGVSVTANAIAGPDEVTVVADELAYVPGSNARRIEQQFAGTSDGQTVTLSVFVRTASGTDAIRLELLQRDGTSRITSSDFPVTTTWTRIRFTASVGTGANDPIWELRSQASGATGTIYGYGAQVELGEFATSYYPTTSAAGTRQADVATLAATDTWDYNQPWQFTYICPHDSSEHTSAGYMFRLASSTNANIRQVDQASPNVNFRLGSNVPSNINLVSVTNLQYSQGDPLTVKVIPGGGHVNLIGFSSGGGTTVPGPFSWATGEVLNYGHDGVGTSPFYGIIGAPCLPTSTSIEGEATGSASVTGNLIDLAAAFSPLDTSPNFWVASDDVTLISTEVNVVNDKSGNAIDFTATGAGTRPDLISADANFNGEDSIDHIPTDTLDAGDVFEVGTGTFTILAVCRPEGTFTQWLIGKRNGTAAGWVVGITSTTNMRFQVSDGTTTRTINHAYTTATLTVVRVQFDGSAYNIWVDGDNANGSGAALNTLDNNETLRIGADAGDGGTFDGQWSDIMGWTRALTAGEVTDLTAWINTKYGLSLTSI